MRKPVAALAGEAGEGRVGSRVGEEVGEAGGDGVVVSGGRGFAQVEKVRGAEEGFVAGEHGLFEVCAVVEPG
ncbi:MAG: hypothetical protein ACK6D7_10055, partial [Acidobacteriota bacterium]